MPDRVVNLGQEPVPLRARDNGDGSYALAVSGSPSSPIPVTSRSVGPIYATSRDLGAAPALTANTDSATSIPPGAVGCLVWIVAGGSVVQGRYAWRDAATAITVSATSMGYLPAQASSHSIPLGMTHLHLACDQAAVGYVTWLY